jgi:hypothetical protein
MSVYKTSVYKTSIYKTAIYKTFAHKMFTQPPLFQNVQFAKQNPVRKTSVFKVFVYKIFYKTSLLCTVDLTFSGCTALRVFVFNISKNGKVIKKLVLQQFNMGIKNAEFYADFQSVEKAAKSYL